MLQRYKKYLKYANFPPLFFMFSETVFLPK